MDPAVDQAIDRVLENEGGLSDHPADRGGLTNRGITRATLAWWRSRPVTEEDMRTLTEAEAREIYLKMYVQNPGFDAEIISPSLRLQLVDFGVHSGPAVAIKKLQEILGVEVDGKLGPRTLAVLHAANQRQIANQLVAARTAMLVDLVVKRPSQLAFLRGWIRRALGFLIP